MTLQLDLCYTLSVVLVIDNYLFHLRTIRGTGGKTFLARNLLYEVFPNVGNLETCQILS